MMAKLFDAFFGCWQQPIYSFPMTIRNKNLRSNAAVSMTGTYVVCLDWCKELPYDWTEMKVASPATRRSRGRGGSFWLRSTLRNLAAESIVAGGASSRPRFPVRWFFTPDFSVVPISFAHASLYLVVV